VDIKAKQKVIMETLHPSLVRDVVFDGVGNIVYADIAYSKKDPSTDSEAIYSEIITPDKFSTFKNDKPYAWFKDGFGNDVSSWSNPYGFVPLVLAPHKRIGSRFGISAAHRIIYKVDETNSQASRLNDQINKTVNSVWAVSGVTDVNQLAVQDSKAAIPIIGVPDGSNFQALVNPLDLGAASANVQNLLLEIERDAPELSLHRIRSGSTITAPGVLSAWNDAISLIIESSANYDSALTRAQMMALTMAGVNGYEGFESFDENSFSAGDLDHIILPRQIILDNLPKDMRISSLVSLGVPRDFILREMGYSKDDIALIADIERKERAASIRRSVTQQATQPPAQPSQPPAQNPVPPTQPEQEEDQPNG
jgi:hypothetical protein